MTISRPALPFRLMGMSALTIAAVCLGMIAPLAAADQEASAAESSVNVAQTVSPDSVPFYVVQPSVNGEPEFLFAIAQRFLGDGNRFGEIFDLNEGRPQPDGSAMTVATSLSPGWILQLPADAQGDGLQFGPIPGSDTAPSPAPDAAGPTATAAPAPASTATTPAETESPSVTSTSTGSAGVSVVLVVVVIVIIIAGAALYPWWRRRRATTPSQPDFSTTDRSASWTIDSALKIVVAACDAEQIAFPGLYLVTVDATSVHLHLSVPSAQVPDGWTASPDGRSWSASLSHLQTQPVPAISNQQFSAVATLGSTDSGRLLLDFHQANGVISVDGPAASVTDVVEGWLTELTSNPWSTSPDVIRLGARGSAQQPTLDEFLARTDRPDTGIAVVEDSPNRAQGVALRQLATEPDSNWIVVIKSTFTSASWAFSARDGLLTSNFLPDVRYPSAPGPSRPILG